MTRVSQKWVIGAAALALACLAAPSASLASTPDFAVAVRAGTPGVGLDLDLGLSPAFGVRVGFSGFDINHNIDTSDVDYDGRLKLATVTGLLDWYVFNGGFHLTAGVAGNETKLDVTGQPSQGAYTINGHTYSSSQLGSLTGQLKFGNSVSPYIGFGWGNPAGEDSRIHFLFDIGAIYGGIPSVNLSAQCGPAAPAGSPVCNEAQSDLTSEEAKLRHKADILQWYPMVSLGIGVRF
ncbi:MAG: autotransporter outer membrane beta-barrel domain-containing protein [Steroidobacteraceae bacterium]